MVQTPQQLIAAATPDEKTLQDLEAKIDSALAKQIEHTGTAMDLTIASSYFGSTLTKNILTERYEAAGWEVPYQSDQRDGDSYRFSDKKQSTKRSQSYWDR